MRGLIYATASCGALLIATAAHAAVNLDFVGDTSASVSLQTQSTDLPGGGVVASKVKIGASQSVYYGGSTTADVEINANSASFTSGVAARGPTATGEATWGASATALSGITATLTNTGTSAVQLNSINSTIIQAGMGFMVQNPTGGAINNDVFTGYGKSQTGMFGDFYKPSLAGQTIATANFTFNVYGDSYGIVGSEAPALYTLSGSVSLGFDANGNIVETSNVGDAQSILSGFAPIYPDLDGEGNALPLTNADQIAGYEWDETPINVALNSQLGAGASTNLYYIATSTVDISMPCISATECLVGWSGFGDPVGRGGGVSADAFEAFDFNQNAPPACPNDTSQICFSPQTIQPFSNLSVGGVPEPASWVGMIMGFGLAGAALRRRRVVSYS